MSFYRILFSSSIQRRPKCFFSKTFSTNAKAVLKQINLSDYPPELIRNFCIIAHIDHGKSTLADRLLEITKTIRTSEGNSQVLDKLKVERDRGITVKAQTVSMFYPYRGKTYLLNLIDTPGHVDFHYEVSRSIAACQGAILLVDACQGIQAQSVANYNLASSQGLSILPVLNKIDRQEAEPEVIANHIENTFSVSRESILKISAKTGLNVEKILPSVIDRFPGPTTSSPEVFKALLFDSWYNSYVGVVCLIAVKGGVIKKGDKISSCHSKKKYDVVEVGLMHPEQTPTDALYPGQVGYFVANMKSTSEAVIGDTFYHTKSTITPLPGFRPPKSMVFSGLFPIDTKEFPSLQESIDKLTLNDSSVSVHKETSIALGQGWRLGFLGTLHMDVFSQRLEQEYGANIICTSPTVPFQVLYKDGTLKSIQNPSEFPTPEERNLISEYQEPMVLSTIIFPEEYLGSVIELCGAKRGEQVDLIYIDEHRTVLKYKMPMCEIVTDFFDQLKSRTSGYASFDYEEIGYAKSDLVRLDVLLNGKSVDALSSVLHKSQIDFVGKRLVGKLKEVIEKQLFEVIIQASANNRIIARETIKPYRKNVIAKCYGGDVTRKMKLLKQQKEGKKRMKMIGQVELKPEAFLAVIKSR